MTRPACFVPGFVPVDVEPTVLVFPPGPMVLDREDGTKTLVHSVADAERLFGPGSVLSQWAKRHFEGQKPLAPCACGAPRTPQDNYACAVCWERHRRFESLILAFDTLADAIELVAAHAEAIQSAEGGMSVADCERIAFKSLAYLALGAPHLLPFAIGFVPGDDGDEW